jgi:hypothetical protein
MSFPFEEAAEASGMEATATEAAGAQASGRAVRLSASRRSGPRGRDSPRQRIAEAFAGIRRASVSRFGFG